MESSQSIQTYVFMDFGTKPGTGTPYEVHLRAVPRDVYLHPDPEEPTDNLKLEFDMETGFNLNTYDEIYKFIEKQKKPVCLVAHNGNRFDFPILKRQLQRLNVTLSDDVQCADSLYAFYDILEHPDEYEGSAVRDIFYEGADKPVASYRLGVIYDRVVTNPPVVPHIAENDTLMKFRISRKLAERFLTWTDTIRRDFADVQPEELDTKFS